MDKENLNSFIKTIGSIEQNLLNKTIEFVDQEQYNPTIVKDKNNLLNSLGLQTVSAYDREYDSYIQPFNTNLINVKKSLANSFFEEVRVQTWKLTSNISAKLIESDNDSVIVECLIDRDKKIYEERRFPIVLFKGYTLDVGNLFKICIYEKDNQMMIEIKDDPNLILDTDFPKIDFFSKFQNLKLKK